VINNRLQPLLQSLITSNQNGFMKDSNVGDNIRLMQNIVDYDNFKNIEGAIISLDLCKVFDSQRWLFIFGMLRSYGFGEVIINWIKTLYKMLYY